MLVSAVLLFGAAGCSADQHRPNPAADEVAEVARSTSNSAALKAAEQYAVEQDMSKARVLELLTSASGEGFTREAAEYAVEHVEVDWKQNAVKRAKSYLGTGLSVAQIREQLVAEYGEQFTKEEADFAAKHLTE